MHSHSNYNVTGNKGQKILPIFNVRKRPKQALYAVPSTLSQLEEKKSSIQLQQRPPAPTAPHAEIKGDWNKPSNLFQNSRASCQQLIPTNTGKGTFQKYVGADQAGTSRKIQPTMLLSNKQLNITAAGSYPPARDDYPIKNNQKTQLNAKRNSSLSTTSYLTPTCSNFSQTQTKKSTAPQMKPSKLQSEQQYIKPSVKTTNNDKGSEDVNKLEKSMKVLTAGVEGVKKWSQILIDDGMLMFEVFGRMNSTVSSNDESNAKLFTLQDGNLTLPCIFYEMDRSLPQVNKGQMVRCVGSFQVTENIFHCVTIRAVSSTEQRWMKAQISACDKALISELAVVKIEP